MGNDNKTYNLCRGICHEHVSKVSAPSPLRLLRRIFFIIFSKIYPLCCHGNQSNSAIWTKFIWIIEGYSRNISVKNLNICSETEKIANFHFSHYKSMESKKISNDQELIQSDPTSCPQSQREITKYKNWQQFTKSTRGKPNEQLFPRQVVIQLPKIY